MKFPHLFDCGGSVCRNGVSATYFRYSNVNLFIGMVYIYASHCCVTDSSLHTDMGVACNRNMLEISLVIGLAIKPGLCCSRDLHLLSRPHAIFCTAKESVDIRGLEVPSILC